MHDAKMYELHEFRPKLEPWREKILSVGVVMPTRANIKRSENASVD